jgi:hypothetical protein
MMTLAPAGTMKQAFGSSVHDLTVPAADEGNGQLHRSIAQQAADMAFFILNALHSTRMGLIT